MKYPTGTSTQAISLSPKLSATFSEGFAHQYNSPKTITAKGFIMSRNPYETQTLLPRSQKRDSSVKSKPTKVANSSALETTIPGQKISSPSNAGQQIIGSREEKRSSSKQKCETLRTVSSTPKNMLMYKTSESVRREDTSYNPNQYKYKKLEISTEFNSKSSYANANKAQTTKHTETDENSLKDLGQKASPKQQQPNQSAQKYSQGKTETASYTFYTEQNADENKAKEGNQFRTSRPLSSYENNSRTATSSLPQGPTKANHQIRNKSKNSEERENSNLKSSYKKSNITPKAGQSPMYIDEKFEVAQISPTSPTSAGIKSPSGTTYSNEAIKRKERPLSAKKPTKEEQQTEKPKETQISSSLQGFVTKVNKGDVFGSIKKYGEKRDNSAQRKPHLNLDDRASKPIRAIELDLKGSRTTPNIESKVFTINLGKTSTSPTAASTQTLVAKNNKKLLGSATKETQKENGSRAKIPGREPFVYYMTHLERAHRWAGEADYFVQLYQEHFLQTFQALSFCKLLKPTDNAVIAQKKVNFPKRETHKDKKTLVFDMDETLIHCNESLDMPADVVLPIIFPNGEVVEAGVNIRPYAIEILRELSQHFEIMVFTASHSCYANVVLDYLDPHEEFIHHRLFRESCVVTEEGLHIKDLRVIGNRNMQDLILIDNAAYSYGFQIENGVPIIPFYDNKADQELKYLIPYLKFLSTVKDLREVNKQTFKLHHFGSYEEPEELLEKVILQG